MADDQQDKFAIERLKIEIDVVKHLSTLNTGSIVLIATLVDKFPKPIHERNILAASLICLGCSLVLCVGYLVTPWSDTRQWKHMLLANKLFFMLAGIGFVVGIALLARFAGGNI